MKIGLNNYSRYGLLGQKQIFEFDSGENTRVCFSIQEYFPFYNEPKEKTDEFVKSHTYTSRSYSPSEVGGYYWVDNNVIAPQEKLGITARQYGRYCKLKKESVLKNLPLVLRVEIALEKAGLNHLIRFNKVLKK